MARQLHCFLHDTDYPHPFQFSIRSRFGTVIAMVALLDDLRREIGRVSESLLILLDLSVTFDVNHGILLKCLSDINTTLDWFNLFFLPLRQD